MTPATARTVANALLVTAAGAAAYYIIRTPPLRRASLRLTKAALVDALPAYLAAQIGRAWVESERAA